MNVNDYQIKNAVVSVSDKTGIVEFCKELKNLNIKIYSTGGTLKFLQEHNIDVVSITEITNFPEILDGRVKTLHPNIHAGILAELDKENHLVQLSEHNISSIDMVVVNLYPFEKKLKENCSFEEMIENIDIGGPTMLRSAAKNYKWTLPVVNPNNYNEIIEQLKTNDCKIPLDYRLKLATEVFNYTAYYDSIISKYLNQQIKNEYPEILTLTYKKANNLRYGENPHQSAALYGDSLNIFEKIHGKELSYNNILDINSALQLIIEFDEPTCAIIKHTNPCGVATAENLVEAYQKAFNTDTVSPFGGIIVFNRKIDKNTAEIVHDLFTELIIAPNFEEDAFNLLTKKKDRRLIKINLNEIKSNLSYDIRSVLGGILIQRSDKDLIDDNQLKVVTQRIPNPVELRSLMFAWKVCKHVKSNAIVYASEHQTLGIGAGQMSRVDSSRIAVEKAKFMGLNLNGSVVASDAFFPFPDGLIEANEAGATAVIQPGGSIRDNEVIEEANKRNMAMIFTGIRHFRH